MPEPIDRKLEELLAYPEQESGNDDLFVVDVMRRVQKERRTRKLILGLFGGIGALFGLAGALMLSETIAGLFGNVDPTVFFLQLPLFSAGAAAFYIWFMNDDLAISR